MRKTGTKWPFLSALHSTSSLFVYFRVRPRLSKHGLWYGSTESNSGEYLCRLIPCLQTFTILSFFYIHLIDSSSSTFGRKFNFSPCKQAWKTKTGFLCGKGCTSDQTFYESEFHLFSFSYSLQKYAFCESDLKTSVRLKRQSHKCLEIVNWNWPETETKISSHTYGLTLLFFILLVFFFTIVYHRNMLAMNGCCVNLKARTNFHFPLHYCKKN